MKNLYRKLACSSPKWWTCLLVLLCIGVNLYGQSDGLPRGAFQMPYIRYEANAAALGGGATMLAPTFDQKKAESEASDQTCASLNATGAFVKWNLSTAGQGLVLRFSIPDNAGGTGQTGSLALFVGGTFVQNINLSSKWSWQYFSANPGDATKDPTNTPSTGATARMRFDEVRVKLAASVTAGTEVKLVKQNGDGINYYVDFIEMEPVTALVGPPAGYLNVTTYGAIPDDANDDKQAFVNAIADARSQGKSIYVPAGRFLLSSKLDLINISNITLQGAGIWNTELYFTSTSSGGGGIATGGTGNNIHMKDFYMNTENTIRTSDYKGFVGGHGTNSSIERVWVEHFEVGYWAANFFGTPVTDGILVTNCRFRNNYADGVNFSRGTSNSICEHSNMRNNGDDAMASWSSSDGPQPCTNNEFRYCTAENTWRAGGIGFFGGGGHKGHHLLIKDNVENGIRVNSDFPAVGNSFSTTLWMEIYETTVISSGTNANLWFNRYGAVDIFTRLYDVQNLRLRNVNINNSQKDAVMIYNVGTSFKITNLEFINVTIDGAGKDSNINNYTAGTWDDYAGYGIYVLPGNPGTNGSMSVTNLLINNVPSTPAINNESPTTFTINTVGTVAVTGVAINPSTAISIPQGGTSQLTAALTPSNATNQNVSWTTSNAAVATVNASGLVTAVSPGTATITVTTQEGNKTATKTITVTSAVNITATDASAGEGGNVGVFTISTSATSSNITVGYTISGTSTSADYTASPALTGSVVLTQAIPSSTITITPVDDSAFEGAETLIVTLQPGAGYNLGGSTTATINIADNDSPPCTAPVIGFTSTAPAIDQTIDAAWSNVPSGIIGNVTFGSMPADFAGSKWRAMYDATNLYLLVEVKDNNKFSDSGTSWWEDDVIEIFIDGDNSKGTSYDGVNDFQLGFRYNDAAVNVGGGSVNRTTGIVFAMQNVTGGYNLEARIPWSTIGVTPVVGNRIGLDVEVDDDDNGGTRDSQVSAFATTSMAWSNPGLFGSVYLTTCSAQPPVSVTGVSVSPTTASLNVGATQQLTATIAPANATNQNVTWSSNNTSVATVSASGLVTAVANGSATITVTTQDGAKTASSSITVTTATVPVTGVAVSPTTASIAVGATQQLTATVAPANATNKTVTWSTNNASVATVSTSGLVTAVAAGSATITVTTQDGAKTATSAITVTVATVSVTGVTLSQTSASLGVSSTLQLTATVAPTSATNKNVTWSSNSTSVATVSTSGLVTAVAAGTATITVTTQDGAKTATCTVTVTSSQTPFGGTAWAIPGTIEIENFDNGGEGVAYHDNDAVNSGGQGRTADGVDTETCSEGGLNIGWTNTGEWLEYTVNVATTGNYNVDVRQASTLANGTFHIEFDGIDKTGLFTTSNTGAWQTWTTISKTGIALTAGQQVMRIFLDNANFNLNKVIFTSVGGNVAVTGVTVSPTSVSVNVGSTQQLTASIAPSNATNKTVTWSSSNTAVATVNATGLVTGVAAGSATIIVTTQDGAKTATSAITVNVAAGITCYKTTGAITVNGNLTESSWAVSTALSKTTVGTPNNTATFGVLWDNTNLYIGAKVLDANLNSDSSDPWEDDGIEIYIDANNNKSTTYDGLDNQIIKNYNKSTVFTKLGITGLQHAWAAISGGYSIEVAIPWSQLGISAPAQGTTIGFDIGYDDDDNAGARDGQAVWNGTVNNYASTAGFGSLVLNTANSPAGRLATQEVSDDSAVKYWPTIVEQVLNIETDGSYHSIEVVDMMGRVLFNDQSISGKKSLSVDLGNTAGGMNIVKLHGIQKSNVFRIIKK